MNDFPEVSENLLSLRPEGMISHDVKPVPYDDWLEFGKKLWTVHRAIQWAIGDWINYGEAHYGEKYAQALDTTEYSYGTLANYAYVAKSFKTSRRRENLSWSHHAAVRGIEDEKEQDALLDIAEKQQMGRNELREVVKKYLNPNSITPVYRIIEGALSLDNKFVPDSGELLKPGKAILHLYEGNDD